MHQRAGQSQALSLTTGQGGAAIRQNCIIAHGHGVDIPVNLSEVGGPHRSLQR